MNASTIISILNYTTAFLNTLLAGLVGFNWLTFFTPEQALSIAGSLSLLSLVVKAWLTTAETMAKQMQNKS